jgi:two-component sensor histidine kinase
MAVDIEMEPSARSESAGSLRQVSNGRPATILIVDDEFVARETLSDLLRAEGFNTITVARGEEAFDWIGQVDLVLLDAMLPDRDGWSICRELKEEHDPLLPVIMVTARAAPADMVRTFDAHADDYITKSFHATELIKRIGTRLRVHRLEQELREMSQRHAELAEQNFRLYQKAAADAEERQALLRELDHRVRNNLAIIMGLVALERHRDPARPAAAALAILENRFRAVHLVYDSLRNQRYRSVPLRAIAERLLQRLRNIAAASGRIELEVTGEAADLGERQAFALALVLNELVTNALNHAFPYGRSGKIGIDVADYGDLVQVTVADDGVGFTPDQNTSSLGSGRSIMDALIRGDLAGELVYHSGPRGTAAVLTFSREHESPHVEGLTA